MRFSTMIEIARTLKIEMPSEQNALREMFLVETPMKDLAAVLKKFLIAQKLLHSEEVLTRLAFEAVEDAYLDGVRILELRYAPTFINDGHSELSFEKIHQAFLKGTQMAESKYNIATGLICIVQRIKSLDVGEKVMNFAIDHKNTFIGVDLADDETACEPKTFSPLFLRARAEGLGVTIHSGEANIPKSPQYVIDSIEYLGAQRIGHGLQIIRDPAALKFVKEKRVPLELCPVSNWLTNAIADKKSHPLMRLKSEGILTTINSDDPGIFSSQLSNDYEMLVQNGYGITEGIFDECNDIAATASFIERNKKQKAWPRKIS